MKHLKKKLLLSLGVLVASTGALADNTGYVLHVNLTDGTSESYLVAHHPVVTFDQQFVTVSCKGLVANYLTAEVKNYTFSSAADWEETLTGDVNSDGIVNALDVREALRAYLTRDYSQIFFEKADFDRDGFINLSDLTNLIENYLTRGGKRRVRIAK